MAISRSLMATSLLLCSLLVVASAGDYGVYDYQAAKPEGEGKTNYETNPLPNGEEKPEYGTKPVSQQRPENEEKPDYGRTSPKYSYKPQPQYKEKAMPEETEKPGYSTKTVNQPQPEKGEKPDYGTKNNFDRQQPEEVEKPELLPIGVEGLVLCKSGPKYYPIQGALARITCLTVDNNGYEQTHSVCSRETDAKGYFLAKLSPVGLDNTGDTLSKQLTGCKAFLESSPLETCNVPVNVNKGISGAPLSDFRLLNQMKMKLFSVGPFFFTSEPNSVPNGY